MRRSLLGVETGRRSVRLILATLIALLAASAALDVYAHGQAQPVPTPTTSTSATPAAVDSGGGAATATPATPAAVVATRDASALATVIQQLVGASGATAGVTLVELGGSQPLSWSLDGGAVFTAASTYKLPALMLEAQNIAAGKASANGLLYYQAPDYEEGWFDDYVDGAAFTRSAIAARAGQQSDNTAGHMLVRDLGGAAVLNAWAASAGATGSSFFDGNITTSNDLAALWVAEAEGRLGGSAAQAWLYPLLTRTDYETGIPAGIPAGITVVHKTGALDLTENDAALVLGASSGPYVLTVLTNGLDETAGPALIAAISTAVWRFESARSAAA